MKNIILLSKDCMPLEILPVYNKKSLWTGKTPNIDELASKGTVYYNHRCAGGSTTMSITAMLSGHYCHEFTSREKYVEVKKNEFPSLFDYFQKNGYSCHIIMDDEWIPEMVEKIGEFGDETKLVIHRGLFIDAKTGVAKKYEDDAILRDDSIVKKVYEDICKAVKSIDLNESKNFIWMHLPHVLRGRESYGADIDVLDEIVGMLREVVGDENIYITSDHGHMNMHKGMVGYGYDVYEPVTRIPLITPKSGDVSEVTYLTSNVDFPRLFYRDETQILPKREYVFCDTQYFSQPKRKLAVITETYKYIFNKENRSEELYDLRFDPNENYNLINESYYDENRKKKLYYREYYYYPFELEAKVALDYLRRIKDAMWVEPTRQVQFYEKWVKFFPILKFIRKIKHLGDVK